MIDLPEPDHFYEQEYIGAPSKILPGYSAEQMREAYEQSLADRYEQAALKEQMSNRIKELYEQAVSVSFENKQKFDPCGLFAELIVKECIEQIDDVINETGENGAYLAYKRVKEHFEYERHII